MIWDIFVIAIAVGGMYVAYYCGVSDCNKNGCYRSGCNKDRNEL